MELKVGLSISRYRGLQNDFVVIVRDSYHELMEILHDFVNQLTIVIGLIEHEMKLFPTTRVLADTLTCFNFFIQSLSN